MQRLYRTKSGSKYVIDPKKKTIKGGYFGDEEMYYEKLEGGVIGGPLIIYLSNGTVKTSTVVAYCQV